MRIGTAGWTIPGGVRDAFPSEGTSLERYAARLNAVEINSSFHRSHRPAIYERWAKSVPADFRFSVKLPKTITHQQRLLDCEDLLRKFAEETAPLAAVRGPTLVQLPPSLAFDQAVAAAFFDVLAAIVGGETACEPRHVSWFEPEVDAFLAGRRIARVAADPAKVPAAAEPGGWPGLIYYRLHGSPRTYYSSYEEERLGGYAAALADRAEAAECWIIFDNTAGGQAAGNALQLADMLTA